MYRRKGRGIKPWMGAGAAFAALVWLVFALGDTLTPFAVAAVLAYVLDPLVEWLQKKGLNRASASMSVMVFSLILLLALLLIIVPMLVGQFNNLASRLPQLIGFMQNTLLPWLKNTIGGYVEIDQASIIAWLQAHTGELSNALKAWFPVLMRQGGNIVSSIGNLLLLPLLLYYFLLDWQRWSCGIAK
ncbi:AI-2E family transporter, partial [Neisseria meningitidis]